MKRISRRDFVRGALATTTLALGRSPHAAASTLLDRLPVLGKVAARDSLTIAASPLSIGFETLDRQMFDPERTYAHVARLGAKWARLHTGWCRTERQRGVYDFTWLDRVVDRLRAIGVQPWLCVGFGNRLYTPEAPFESAVGWVPSGTAEGRAAWLAYVGRLAEHYRGRVRHYEIWNEPNGKSFWRPGTPDPRQYVEFVALTAPVIRQRIPDAVIIGGAVAGMDTRFFQASMECGLGQHIQKASFHSYRPWPEKSYAEDVTRWRQIIARHRPGIQLWHGEVGAASQPGGAGGRANYPWTETRQAKWMLRRFVSDLRMKIELVSYFHTVDLVNYGGADGPTGRTNFKGLLRGTDYSPKPAYFAYQCLCALFDGQTVREELPLHFAATAGTAPVPLDEIVWAGFVRRGKALYAFWHPPGMAWERADVPVDVSLPVRAVGSWTAPVLIDPLTSTVYGLPAAQRRGDQWQIAGAPLADHPLLLTDRAVALG
jgi:hypothetical protein